MNPAGIPTPRQARTALLDERDLRGKAWSDRYVAALDSWLEQLLGSAAGGDVTGLALLAVGGYGRAELAPGSDLDLLLVHDGKRKAIRDLAEALWYPIWDSGVPLDHSVRTVREVRAAMESDIKVALGLLDARRVAGDPDLAGQVRTKVADLWSARAGRWLPALADTTAARHQRSGDLAFLLEPDLKDSRGGLRDLHLLRSLSPVVPFLPELLAEPGLSGAGDLLLATRVELHRLSGRQANVLLLQDQDAVATALGYVDADKLMSAVAGAGRAVAWTSDDAWRRIGSWLAGPRGRAGGADRPIEPGLVVRDGEVALAGGHHPGEDPSLALRAAAASAELGLPLARTTLDRLVAEAAVPQGPWPREVLDALLRLLGAGPAAVGAVEALDQKGLWGAYLPEWEPVRNLPQRNAYHRFTVDRHLVETAVGAGRLQSRVARPDLLLLGALLHDIGKGRGPDHSAAGVEVVQRLAPRLGLPPSDVRTLETLVLHHLLLADTATRRDLDDPTTAERVAMTLGDRVTLDLLAALTEADSLATGPAAWGPWKAGLVSTLVERAGAILEGRPDRPPRRFELTPAEREMLGSGRLELFASGGALTVAAPDRPGLLATIAGVLNLSGVNVRSAATLSDTPSGMALLRFEVLPAFDRLPDWERVRADLEAALGGRLPLDRLLEEREAHYSRFRGRTSAQAPEVAVLVDREASSEATVVEVRAPDRGPILYRLASAITSCGFSISRALVSTLGAEAVDVFYLQGPDGEKLDDPSALEQVIYALREAAR